MTTKLDAETETGLTSCVQSICSPSRAWCDLNENASEALLRLQRLLYEHFIQRLIRNADRCGSQCGLERRPGRSLRGGLCSVPLARGDRAAREASVSSCDGVSDCVLSRLWLAPGFLQRGAQVGCGARSEAVRGRAPHADRTACSSDGDGKACVSNNPPGETDGTRNIGTETSQRTARPNTASLIFAANAAQHHRPPATGTCSTL
jgi:hypothetical protein